MRPRRTVLEGEEFPDSDIQWSTRLHTSIHQYSIGQGLLSYCTDIENIPRFVIPQDEEVKCRIIYESHGIALRGYLGR